LQVALQRAPNNQRLLSLGIAFFERLTGENDVTLTAAGLSRPEIQTVLIELRARNEKLSGSTS
jgi:hypothetical protein